MFTATQATLNANALIEPAAAAERTIRQTCAECMGAGLCTWQSKNTGDRFSLRCNGCEGIGYKSVKDFSPPAPLPSLAQALPLLAQESLSPPPSPRPPAAAEVEPAAPDSPGIEGIALPSALPSFPVLVLSRGELEPHRQEERYAAAAKARTRSTPRSVAEQRASPRLMKMLEAVLSDERTTRELALDQAETVVLAEAAEEPMPAAEEPAAESAAEPAMEEPAEEQQAPGGCMSGDPMSTEEESKQEPWLAGATAHTEAPLRESKRECPQHPDEAAVRPSPAKKPKGAAEEGCVGGCKAAATRYRALSMDHPYECIQCGRPMTYGQLKIEGLQCLGVNSALLDAAGW